MRMRIVIGLILFAGITCLATPRYVLASSTEIQYQISNVSGNEWQYTYTINNPPTNSLSSLQAFTVFFDYNLTSNLQDTSTESTSNWSIFSLQPDSTLLSDGNYVAQALTDSPMTIPFTITFDYLGSGTPGAQPFSIDQFDANGNLTANIITGNTSLLGVTVTPEPASLVLMLSGLVTLLGIFKIGKKRIHGITT